MVLSIYATIKYGVKCQKRKLMSFYYMHLFIFIFKPFLIINKIMYSYMESTQLILKFSSSRLTKICFL
eukprot:SAG31_NODE_7095_length_1789_cov_22.649704_3_plen_68_part_00